MEGFPGSQCTTGKLKMHNPYSLAEQLPAVQFASRHLSQESDYSNPSKDNEDTFAFVSLAGRTNVEGLGSGLWRAHAASGVAV